MFMQGLRYSVTYEKRFSFPLGAETDACPIPPHKLLISLLAISYMYKE